MPTIAPSLSLLTTPEKQLLRVLLFGRPGSGKTTLLAALLQTEKRIPDALPAKVTDLSRRLTDLHNRVYSGDKPQMVEDVAAYPVRIHPEPDRHYSQTTPPPLDALLIDCSGEAANAFIEQATGRDPPNSGELARQMRKADALILLLDVSGSAEQTEADFADFARLLQELEEQRGRRVEVGGWPVYLVLTKVDRLARPGDTHADWVDKIEAKKQALGQHFRDFLDRWKQVQGDPPEEETDVQTVAELATFGALYASMHKPPRADTPHISDAGFGWIDLNLWAVAACRPDFNDNGKQVPEPFGVGELFGMTLRKAWQYRQERHRSSDRMLWLTGGLLSVVAGMAILMASMILGVFPGMATPPPTAAERLAGTLGQLRKKLENFQARRNSPQFATLPPREQEEILFRITELQAYIPYFEKVLRLPRPGMFVSEQSLREVIETLEDDLKPPREEWRRTTAARMRDDLLEDLTAVRETAAHVKDWYNQTAQEALKLWSLQEYRDPEQGRIVWQNPVTGAINWRLYRSTVEGKFRSDWVPPFEGSTPVPGAGRRVTYDAVLDLDTVREARARLELYKDRIQQVLQVTAALGLETPAGKTAPLLVESDVTPADVSRLTELLRRDYPAHEQFSLDQLPEVIHPHIIQSARTSYRYLIPPGRQEVLERYQKTGSGAETRARWLEVRQWLEQPDTMSTWRALAGALLRLGWPEPVDPVGELAEFLGKDRFTLAFLEAEVAIPLSSSEAPPVNATLNVYHTPTAGAAPAVRIPLDRTSYRDGKDILNLVWRYKFDLSQRREIEYRPGDDFRVELDLQGGKTLSWVSGNRSSMYQFERVHYSPHLHATGQPPANGGRQPGVRLTIARPAGAIPRLPDLLPQVP